MRLISVSILGSTGSIGTQTLQVIEEGCIDEPIRVVALAAKHRWKDALKQAKEFGAEFLAIEDYTAAEKAEKAKQSMGLSGLKIVAGSDGLKEAASLEEVDTVVHGIPGLVGLAPLIGALEAEKRVVFAGKESLVSGGDLLGKYLTRRGQGKGSLVPCDSEHSAIFQCLQGESYNDVDQLVLTASGGAFRDLSFEELKNVSPQDALKHPTWKMGPKVTVDSATLFNKALEVIEAHYLFGIPYERISVVIHRESIVHSMVAFKDGTVKAVLSRPDMKVAIAYALSYPKRGRDVVPRLNPYLGTLSFQEPDLRRFPCLSLGKRAGEMGGTAPLAISRADEMLVEEFLRGTLAFTDIYRVLDRVLKECPVRTVDSLDTVMEEARKVDDLSRRLLRELGDYND